MYRHFRVSVWLVASLFVTHTACSSAGTVSLRDLERDPSSRAARMVTVLGCYHNGPETTVLLPCTQPRPEEVVWVVSRSQLENTAKSVPGYAAGSMKLERPSAKEMELAQQLSQLPDGVVAEVLLRGEFRSSSNPEFGISPGYRYEFVVHRVLSVSPRWPSR